MKLKVAVILFAALANLALFVAMWMIPDGTVIVIPGEHGAWQVTIGADE